MLTSLFSRTLFLALVIAGLPGCFFCAKGCKQASVEKCIEQEKGTAKDGLKRISGPLSDQDITWTEEDFK